MHIEKCTKNLKNKVNMWLLLCEFKLKSNALNIIKLKNYKLLSSQNIS